MKILNFGSCNIDTVYSVDHVVRVGETLSTRKMEIFPGGKGLNQSIAIARAGAEVYHAGCIGRDGEMLKELLLESGVDVSFLRTVDAPNGHAIIQVSAKGDNSIFIYGGSNEMVSEDFIDSVLSHFGAGDIVLLQNEISNIPYIIEKAYEKKMCIIFNPSPLNDAIKEIDLYKLSYMILNEIEATELSACEDTEAALAYFRENYPELKVMLTLGDQGSVYIDKECELRQHAFETKVVDTTAAGDTFTGYFVAGISFGMPQREILKLASAASAIAVSRNGAAPSIPSKREVLESFVRLKATASDNKYRVLQGRIEAYIEENIKDASLEGLAQTLNYSTVYTGSLVKRLTGKSFSELLQSRRCHIAAQLLLHTDLSVKAIICRVGYENESFFRRLFRKKYGKSPLAFRKGS